MGARMKTPSPEENSKGLNSPFIAKYFVLYETFLFKEVRKHIINCIIDIIFISTSSDGNLDICTRLFEKILKSMRSPCKASFSFHFEGSQLEVAVANSPKIILHQNLSSPKILNKCTFSTPEVSQIS